MIMCLDMVLYGSPMTIMQGIGFSIAGAGTYHYSRLKESESSKKAYVKTEVDLEQNHHLLNGVEDEEAQRSKW